MALTERTGPVRTRPRRSSPRATLRRLAGIGALGVAVALVGACASTSSAPLAPPGSGTTVPSVVRVENSGTAPVSMSSSTTPADNATEERGGTQPPTSPVQGRPKTPDPAPAPAP